MIEESIVLRGKESIDHLKRKSLEWQRYAALFPKLGHQFPIPGINPQRDLQLHVLERLDGRQAGGHVIIGADGGHAGHGDRRECAQGRYINYAEQDFHRETGRDFLPCRRRLCILPPNEKGKLVERRGRKTTGLRGSSYDGGVAELTFHVTSGVGARRDIRHASTHDRGRFVGRLPACLQAQRASGCIRSGIRSMHLLKCCRIVALLSDREYCHVLFNR